MQRWRDWLDQARADHTAAQDMFNTKHWEWCCFACQQSAEKFLKAVLDARRLDHEGHSLNGLLYRVQGVTEVTDEVRDACATLNRFYIPTRYPDAHEEGSPTQLYRERDARNALDDLTIVAQFAESLVGPSPS